MGIALEVGKTYRTANGGTVTIEHDKGDDTYPFFGKIVGMEGMEGMEGVADRLAYFTAVGSYSLAGATAFDIQAVVVNRNELFLSAIDSKAKALILESIAAHYGITAQEAHAEVTDNQAEHLLDYMVEPQRSATSVLMQRHGMIIAA
ncbi:hypothetical protein [Pseudomonas chlororaphis]